MRSSSAPAPELGAFRPSVVLSVPVSKQVEIMQAAEILYRELRSRGVAILFDDLGIGAEAPIHLTLSEGSMRTGSIEIHGDGRGGVVNLEDAVDETLRRIHA